ncbi:MAG: hypothetical protein PWQ22_1607 [Archaeoglobaceae archaeon]|nr:hypothetical protein [Archaeoglobaceae archaeon]
MKPKIRFLYFEGCPHAEPALKLFLGSPTIQINGLDIEKKRREQKAVMGCRVYENGSGVPPKELIVEALREQLG